MWFFEGKEYEYDEAHYGFVYLIENLKSGRKYIGRKYLTKAATKQVKGKKKKIRKESDWKDYYGSSPQLQQDVEQLGKDNFKRTILRLCKTRGEVNYFETKEIFDRDAILRDDYYNGIVQCRIHSNHVKNLLVEGAS